MDFTNHEQENRFIRSIFDLSVNTLERAVFDTVNIYNFGPFQACLQGGFRTLKSLVFDKCSAKPFELMLRNISCLESIEFSECSQQIYHLFKNQTNVKKVSLKWEDFMKAKFEQKFNELLVALSSDLKHLRLIGFGSSKYFDTTHHPYQLKILEADALHHDYIFNNQVRSDFLISQRGSLRVVNIEKFPFNYDGAHVLDIMHGMNLEQFEHRGRLLCQNQIYENPDVIIGSMKEICSINRLLYYINRKF